jgi:hypothetical protein
MSKALTKFDYEGLDKQKLVYFAGQLSKCAREHASSGMEIGRIIAEAHELFALAGQGGKFTAWVEYELRLSRQTAYNYMWAWQRFGNCKSLLQFTQEALYTLASPKVPEPAAFAAIKLADKGEQVDKKKAKELIGRCGHKTNGKPPKPPSTPAPPVTVEVTPDVPGVAVSGDCPNCGDHQRGADGTCDKCLDPPAISGGTTFDPAEIEAVTEAQEQAFAEKVRLHNLLIERFCKRITEAATTEVPVSAWLDDSRLGMVSDHVKGLCGTIRQAKAHDKPCPKCDGAGANTGKPCKTCRGCGFLPKVSYEMAGGE